MRKLMVLSAIAFLLTTHRGSGRADDKGASPAEETAKMEMNYDFFTAANHTRGGDGISGCSSQSKMEA